LDPLDDRAGSLRRLFPGAVTAVLDELTPYTLPAIGPPHGPYNYI
jgi:hypothetical protein